MAGTAKLDLVRNLGADHVLDHTRENFSDGGPRFDVILDVGGNAGLGRLRRALTPRGRLVIIGGETAGRLLGGSGRQIRATLLSRFTAQTLGTFIATENAADLSALAELIEGGGLSPAIDRIYPLAETAAAIRHLLDGRALGKLVVSLSPADRHTAGSRNPS
jgi:NADPH:quinone reductase-like Zn-dependent oxidoreductase